MTKETKNLKYYQAIGRRKKSVAQVRLYLVNRSGGFNLKENNKSLLIKKGEIYINFKPYEKIYFHPYEKNKLLLPLKITDNLERFAISIVVKGGGKSGQLEAIIHGLSRAIEQVNKEQYRPILKKAGLLMRDPRKKERRKVGTGGKARREKQSPKR